MIVRAIRVRRVPRFYIRHVIRVVLGVVARNPGFHRLVIYIDGVGAPVDTGYLVNPDIEPQVRHLLGRVLILEPAEPDYDPWAAL